jgi:hypothetical protein
MVKMSKFPKIGQYVQVVKEIQMMSSYIGKDDLGNALYDNTLPKPKVIFNGLVKLHGTNAGVGYNDTDGLWVQSRENVITPLSDNAGFATFVESKRELFNDMIQNIRDHERETIGNGDGIVIFGEWAGGSIQKGVAISGIEKSFFIFDVKIIPENDDDPYYVESDYLSDVSNRIFNIQDFLSYEIEIDFNRPDLAQAKLIEITNAVEELCPVGKSFGIEGIGEGVVWSAKYKGSKLRFKVKGDKHAGVSKVKTLNPVDSEKITRIHDLVNKIVPERLEQQLSLACDLINGGQIERKFLGDYIRLVIKDTIDERLDDIIEAGFEPNDINKYISVIAKTYFFDREKELI